MYFLAVFALFFLAGQAQIQIISVIPPSSPIDGGIEVYVQGSGFNDTVFAVFSVNPSTYVPAKSVTNYNGRLTASFIVPAQNRSLSSLGQWIRLVEGQNWSPAVSFYWEDSISISSVQKLYVHQNVKYLILGSNFTSDLSCSLPNHPPIRGKAISSSMLSCLFPTAFDSASSISVMTPSGSIETYYFSAITNLVPEYGNASLIFAWAGAADRTSPDYVAIVDAIPTSPTYRQVIAKALLPADINFNNEPHHMQLVNNQTILVASGILSYLTRPQQLFFWDITNPLKPVYMKGINTTDAAVDDVFLIPSGGFLVSLMGAPDGSSPGSLGEWDANMNLVGEYPPMSSRPNDLNPHGISIREDLDILITSDFLDVKSTLYSSNESLILRGSVRIWNPWSQRAISSTIRIPGGSGLMDVKFVPNDPNVVAYVSNPSSTGEMLLWGISAVQNTYFQALNLSQYLTFSSFDFMIHQPNPSGTRYVMSSPVTGYLLLVDTTDSMNPKFLDVLKFGANSGLHSLDVSSDGNYIMVSGYFINEDSLGYIHFDGDRKVHVVKLDNNQLIDTDFNVDFNVAGSYPMRPHMCRFYNKPVALHTA